MLSKNLRLEEKVMIFFSMENNIDEETVLIPPNTLVTAQLRVCHTLIEMPFTAKLTKHRNHESIFTRKQRIFGFLSD